MVLERLRGGLIVSCQPVSGGPLDRPEITAALALAALDGGAVGLRIEGIANLRAVRRVTSVPIIGLIKVDLANSPVRITPTSEEIRAIAGEGIEIIAFDATDRTRPEPVQTLVDEILKQSAIAMADCSNSIDAQSAVDLGCQVLGTTLSGYTGDIVPTEPDFDLVAALADLRQFTIAEGRYNRPEAAMKAVQCGADAIVVGSAITRPEHVTSWFVQAMASASK